MKLTPFRSRFVLVGIAIVAAVSAIGGGCGTFLTDAATRLSRQLCEEADALRSSGSTTRTFEHRPIASPEGIHGDYRIEFVGSAHDVGGDRVILVGESYDGPLRYSATTHWKCVQVERDFKAPHRKGEATIVTLEKRGNEVWVTEVR